MVSASVKGVVLAGGKTIWSGEPKALLPINGTPLLWRIIAALQAQPEVKRIAVVGTPELLALVPEPVVKVPATADLWANTQLGIQAVQPNPDDYLLLCAADMPFVTAKSLRTFLDMALATGADLVYLAVPMAAVQRFFGAEKVRRTSATLREGELTGGNLLLVRVSVLPNIVALAEPVIHSRKSRWQLAKIAGARILLKWLLSLLPFVGRWFLVSVEELERRGKELLQCRCKGIIADLPELAFDIDQQEDYELAQRYCSRTGRGVTETNEREALRGAERKP